MKLSARLKLKKDAASIWNKAKEGAVLSKEERKTMREAYWEGVLPQDPDAYVGEWIELDMPQLTKY